MNSWQGPEDERTEPAERPFQFGLRSLLIGVTLAGGLLAILVRLDWFWSLGLVWILLLAGAHVAANAWGTKVKQRVGRQSLQAEQTGPAPAIKFAPSTRLRRSHSRGRTMLFCGAAGAVLGGIGGTLLLATVYVGRAGFVPIALGGGSAAILGGLLGFLSSSFLNVAGHAMREAAEGRSPAEGR
jgi:hypothetical protein